MAASPIELTLLKDEQDRLSLVSAVKSGAFNLLLARMRRWAAEASEDMLGNVSSDPKVYMGLQMRWQEREKLIRDVVQYVREMTAEVEPPEESEDEHQRYPINIAG